MIQRKSFNFSGPHPWGKSHAECLLIYQRHLIQATVIFYYRNFLLRGTDLLWFKNYWSARNQFVSCDRVSPNNKLISCGVRQGKTLYHLLFLVYVNNLYLTALAAFFIFDGDSSVWEGWAKITIKMNTESSQLDTWFKANKLSLSTKKVHLWCFYLETYMAKIPSLMCKLSIIFWKGLQSQNFMESSYCRSKWHLGKLYDIYY